MVVFDREVVNVGGVSARHFDEELQPGAAQVAEVESLYSSDGFRLVQPTLVRFRSDKDPRDCGLGQLVVGARVALASERDELARRGPQNFSA